MIATIISIVFFIVKFIEMRFIEKESKPLKYLVRDTLLVYFSVITGNFILEQIQPIIKSGSETTIAFTNNPDF